MSSYYSGSVNDMDGLRLALIAACADHGWQWNSDNSVLFKNNLFVQIVQNANGLFLLGRTTLTDGNAPNSVHIGKMHNSSGRPDLNITYPARYEMFLFTEPDEVYLLVNYDIDRYQWAAFGRSVVALPGTGLWFAAIGSHNLVTGGSNGPFVMWASASNGNNRIAPALLWGRSNGENWRNYWVHSDLDTQAWQLEFVPNGGTSVGISHATELITRGLNNWTGEGVLIPVRAYKLRAENRISLICDLANVRHTRIDNYEPGEVIVLGSERWKVFPWHQKNIAVRNGGDGIAHSGTFGWAIRYEGP